MIRAYVVAVFVVAACCGCVGGEDGAAGVDDPPAARCPDDLPPPSDACLAGQCGNALGVGRPCTKGGGQCDVFNLLAGEAGICIPDFADNTAVHACSMPCQVDDDCGAGAVCAIDPTDATKKGCSLVGCEGR